MKNSLLILCYICWYSLFYSFLATSGPALVPAKASLVGQQVAKFQESLEKIPVDVISYGIIFHPQLSEGGCQLPVAIQRSMRGKYLLLI